MPAYAAHLQTAMEAAIRAGQLLRQSFGAGLSSRGKSNARDLVTEADLRSQATIIEILQRDFADIPVIAEEGLHQDTGSELVWLVDPLDGTTNFTRGIEFFSVSICLSFGLKPVAAVVYHPIFDHLYTAESGGGAHLNGGQLRVSANASLEEFTVSSNLSYRDDERLVILDNLGRLMLRTAGLRLIFSVALELCLVGRGSFDAAMIYQANPWDMAAGCLIAREAGGRVTNWSGEEWQVSDANCLASNGRDHERLLGLLRAGE